MEEKDIYDILNIILERIKGKDFLWRLEGSANLKLQGMELSVKDLDIITSSEGVEVFREALKEYIEKDFYDDKLKAHSLVCNINGFEVEINCEDDKMLEMFDKVKNIDWRGLSIPTLPLENAKEFYRIVGKQEKVDLIEKYLKK